MTAPPELDTSTTEDEAPLYWTIEKRGDAVALSIGDELADETPALVLHTIGATLIKLGHSLQRQALADALDDED